MSEIIEGFCFLGVHTKEYEMKLKERYAPSPTEKEIIEDVPFMHGVYDFSDFLGERIFNNRPLTFVFELYEKSYTKRKIKETVISNWLLRKGIQPLYDDHAKGYYWMAKCTNVDINDDHIAGRLIINISFEAYPYKKAILEEGNDIWDDFNFELDYAQQVEFTINNSKTVTIFNPGSKGVTPTIIANSSFVIEKNNTTYNINAGETNSEYFRLEIGENLMTITGNGNIKFEFYKELI